MWMICIAWSHLLLSNCFGGGGRSATVHRSALRRCGAIGKNQPWGAWDFLDCQKENFRCQKVRRNYNELISINYNYIYIHIYIYIHTYAHGIISCWDTDLIWYPKPSLAYCYRYCRHNIWKQMGFWYGLWVSLMLVGYWWILYPCHLSVTQEHLLMEALGGTPATPWQGRCEEILERREWPLDKNRTVQWSQRIQCWWIHGILYSKYVKLIAPTTLTFPSIWD